MTRKSRKTQRRIIASLMTGVFMLQQTMTLSVMATDITGITGQNGVYNIDPTKTEGSVGFRGYENFNLSEGDIANLNFADINTFINLVDNQIVINGIVNSMRGNNFYNGKAVFISPNGMVVGASGVLNVGSLSVYSPNSDDYFYKNLKNKQTVSAYDNFTNVHDNDGGVNTGGPITIKGKVITSGDVTLTASTVNIGNGAGVIAGVNSSQMNALTSQTQADALFNNLVKTNNLNIGNQFASDGNGNIIIQAQGKGAQNGVTDDGVLINGTVKNFATGSGSGITIKAFEGTGQGIKIGGEVSNANGTLYINNNGAGIEVSGQLRNNGETLITNASADGLDSGINVTNTGNINTQGNLKIVNTGSEGINIDGTFNHSGNANIQNGSIQENANDAAGMNINGNVNISGDATLLNTAAGSQGLNINGQLNTGNANITNNGAGGLNVSQIGNVNTQGLAMTNTGAGGLNINGNVNNTGTSNVHNTNGELNVSGTFVNVGDTTFTNDENSQNFNITGSITNTNGTLAMLNENGSLNIKQNANVTNRKAENGQAGNTTITNNGADGLNIEGNVNTSGDVTFTNTGAAGTYIASTARVNSATNININDTSNAGTRVQGLVNAKNNVNINENGGNLVIGDNTENDNYITAGNDINLTVADGSILNYGVEKVLLNAGGDLTMLVTDGTIGLPVQQAACEGSGCTGIGPKDEGARDFTKSINANIKGKVNASTKNTKAATKPEDLVINYAAIDSDMNIDTISADGRVILTVDDDYGYDNNGTRYNMVNARPDDNSKTNITGRGISLIANGSIGDKDNAVTFIQTGAADGYSMDALANVNINLKENSYNDVNFGPNNEITENKVCTMIAREGDLNVEFAGNTTIENITAEGNMSIITRGQNIEIHNLGHIEDDSVTPVDYFGPHHDGYEFDGGYDKDDHKSEILPNNVEIKALDINHNLRPTQELVDGHQAWANSTVRVDNAVLDNGTMDITADNIYANGIHVNFGKDGYTKEADNSTSKVLGADEIPTGNAVRPDDVEAVGRDETERNYYYHEGDGDGVFDGTPSNVDPDDGIIDATPLELEDEPTPEPQPAIENVDGKIAYIQRRGDMNIDAIDKRQYMRFNVSETTNPVLMEKSNNGVSQLLDVSRGGIAVKHDNSLKVGDIIPVHLNYGDLNINADAKVVSSTNSRAGAEFININQDVANQLLYLNILLEKDNNLLAGKY